MSDFEQGAFDGFKTPDEVTPAKRPPGRPRGTKGKFRTQLDKAFRMRWHEAFEKLMADVLAGEPVATQIYWARVFPRPQRMTVLLEGMPEIKSPADARAAMGTLLQQATRGELATDDAQALMMMTAAYLHAHSIQALSSPTLPVVDGTSARDLLANRLERAIEARSRSAPELNGTEPGSQEEPAITEEEIKAQVQAAVRAAVEGMNGQE